MRYYPNQPYGDEVHSLLEQEPLFKSLNPEAGPDEAIEAFTSDEFILPMVQKLEAGVLDRTAAERIIDALREWPAPGVYGSIPEDADLVEWARHMLIVYLRFYVFRIVLDEYQRRVAMLCSTRYLPLDRDTIVDMLHSHIIYVPGLRGGLGGYVYGAANRTLVQTVRYRVDQIESWADRPKRFDFGFDFRFEYEPMFIPAHDRRAARMSLANVFALSYASLDVQRALSLAREVMEAVLGSPHEPKNRFLYRATPRRASVMSSAFLCPYPAPGPVTQELLTRGLLTAAEKDER